MLKRNIKQIFSESINKLNLMITSLDKQLGTISSKAFTEKLPTENINKIEIPKPTTNEAKKQPKEESKSNKKNVKEEAKVDPLISLFEECDLRVGKVVELNYLEDSDTIYALKIDLGESSLREIGTGLRKHVKEDQILNTNVVVFSNLKPKKLISNLFVIIRF
jgi:tRNA-binding EMAP/Myf-like protein